MSNVQSFCLVPTDEKRPQRNREVITENNVVNFVVSNDMWSTTQKNSIHPFVILDSQNNASTTNQKPLVEKSRKFSRRKSSKRSGQNDVLTIDENIMKQFNNSFNEIPSLERRKRQLEWIYTNSTVRNERNSARRFLFEIEKEIDCIKSRKSLNEYKNLTESIIEKYREILDKNNVQCFVRTEEDEKTDREKQELRNRYLLIASKFTDIEPITISDPQKDLGEYCISCGCVDFYTYDESTSVCIKCGVHNDRINLTLTYRDTERINLIPRFNYTRRGHMNEALQKFQGKQNTTIPKEVFSMLHEEMEKNRIDKNDFTKGQIDHFLRDHGYGEQYENINLIHHIITGKECPDLSQYEVVILQMSDQIEEVYPLFKDPERTNSMNVYYKLWKICEILGLTMNRDDFSFLKTRLKIREHDDVCEPIFRHLGWDFEETDL